MPWKIRCTGALQLHLTRADGDGSCRIATALHAQVVLRTVGGIRIQRHERSEPVEWHLACIAHAKAIARQAWPVTPDRRKPACRTHGVVSSASSPVLAGLGAAVQADAPALVVGCDVPVRRRQHASLSE